MSALVSPAIVVLMATPTSPGGRLKEIIALHRLAEALDVDHHDERAASPRSRPMMPQMSAAYSRPESSSEVESMAEPEEEGD